MFREDGWRMGWQDEWEKRQARWKSLAAQLLELDVVSAVERLTDLETAADLLSPARRNHHMLFYRILADMVPDTAAWTTTLCEQFFDPQFVDPFASRLMSENHAAADEQLLRLLTMERYKPLACDIALSLDPPGRATNVALSLIHECGSWDLGRMLRLRMPPATAAQLLSHVQPSIRTAAAVSIWLHWKDSGIP